MKDTVAKSAGVVLALVVMLGIVAIINIALGWLLSTVWNFIAPTFNLPEMSIPVAIGVMVVLTIIGRMFKS